MATFSNAQNLCTVKITLVRFVYRGSYMSVPVLLNLLSELWKRDKMQAEQFIVSLFCNKLNKTKK